MTEEELTPKQEEGIKDIIDGLKNADGAEALIIKDESLGIYVELLSRKFEVSQLATLGLHIFKKIKNKNKFPRSYVG